VLKACKVHRDSARKENRVTKVFQDLLEIEACLARLDLQGWRAKKGRQRFSVLRVRKAYKVCRDLLVPQDLKDLGGSRVTKGKKESPEFQVLLVLPVLQVLQVLRFQEQTGKKPTPLFLQALPICQED